LKNNKFKKKNRWKFIAE